MSILHAATSMLVLGIATTLSADNVDLPRFPSVSPDGSTVVFSWHGDLWRVPVEGGTARRLTTHPADDLRSAWSPDGAHIAFTSTRFGPENIMLMTPDGTDIRVVTNTDRPCTLTGWGTDEAGDAVLLFHAVREGDVYRDTRPYAVSPEGGPIQRVHDAFGSHPAASPGGTKVVFDRGGYYDGWERRHYRGAEASDVWTWDRATDAFTQLTDWTGNDGKAQWLDDDTVLFLSDRELDSVNLYRMDLGGAANARRLTGCDGIDIHDYGISADRGTAVVHIWNTLYALDLTDPDAELVAIPITASEDADDAYMLKTVDREVSEAALSPDGKVMAVVAFGEVFVRAVEDKSPTRRVTRNHAREQHLAWSPDGLKLYFSSDEGGTEGIYAATVERTRDEVKKRFEEATTPKDEEAEEAEQEEETAAEAGDGDEAETGEKTEEEADDEKDEAKEDEDEPVDPALDPERWQDALTFTIEPVVTGGDNARNPWPSPDGKTLAYRGVRGDVFLRDIATGETRTLLEHWDAWVELRWSPDGRYIAYAQSDLDFNSDIFIVPADGSAEPVNITRHPDNDSSPRWSADGKVLAFVSDRVNDETDIWLVFLEEDLDAMTPRERDAYFAEAEKAAKKRKPLSAARDDDDDDDDEDDDEGDDGDDGDDEKDDEAEEKDDEAESDTLELDNAYLRVRRITSLPGGEGNLELHPAGSTLYFSASGPESGLHSIKWDGSDRKSIGGMAGVAGIDLQGDNLVLVGGRQAQLQPTGGGSRKTIGISDRIRIEHELLAEQKFLEAARTLGELFADPELGGVNWTEATERYLTLARTARSAEAFNWVAARFIGELNGSHLGVRAPGRSSPISETIGRLCIDATIVGNGFRVEHVVPFGPAARGSMALQVGDVITGIQFEPLAARDTLDERLRGRAGEETVVTIERTLEDGTTASLDVLITPAAFGQERQLRYEAWRDRNAELVAEWTNGRVGYIHIQGMSQPSLDVFERDLFAAAHGREGLIIDVRNNGGGWTADRLLSSIMVEQHAYTIPRGADPEATGHYPQDRLFIQRWTMPINMLCNEKSYSNAEIISHAFKTLGRGTLVGQQTHGSVISTGGWTLVDGTFVRLPFRAWFVNDEAGTNMELNGALPDLVVPQTPDAEQRGEDEQLKAAVEDLVERL